MDAFVMSKMDDCEIDCYHQYIAQTNYQCEQPRQGDRTISYGYSGCLDNAYETFNPMSGCNYTREDADYRLMRSINNARNGLNTSRKQRIASNDYYNCMPRKFKGRSVPISEATYSPRYEPALPI